MIPNFNNIVIFKKIFHTYSNELPNSIEIDNLSLSQKYTVPCFYSGYRKVL
jgi:hypothetical protein